METATSISYEHYDPQVHGDFFTKHGEGVTFQYFQHLRDMLKLVPGEGLMEAIYKLQKNAARCA